MQSKQPLALPQRYGDASDPRHPDTRMPICANYSKGVNKFGDHVCLSDPVKGRERCRMHGGTTPRGVASPNYRGKDYSRDMPQRLVDRFNAALVDEKILELNSEIALLDARIGELLGRIDTGESGAAWKAAFKSFGEMKAAMQSQDVDAATAAMLNLEAVLNEANADYLAWGEIQAVVQQRRALVETERRRRVEMQTSLDVKEAMLLVGAIGGIIKARVNDPVTLAAIQADIAGLLDRQSNPAA